MLPLHMAAETWRAAAGQTDAGSMAADQPVDTTAVADKPGMFGSDLRDVLKVALCFVGRLPDAIVRKL